MTDEYISREKTLELLKSLSSRDYRRKKGTIQDAIKMILGAEAARWLFINTIK